MRRYLFPRILRKGSPILHFISYYPDDGAGKPTWRLGVFYDLRPKRKPGPYKGESWEYNSVNSTRISEDLFDALKVEAKANYQRYKPQPQ